MTVARDDQERQLLSSEDRPVWYPAHGHSLSMGIVTNVELLIREAPADVLNRSVRRSEAACGVVTQEVAASTSR